MARSPLLLVPSPASGLVRSRLLRLVPTDLWDAIAIGLFADEGLLAGDEFEYAGDLLTGDGIDLLMARAGACLVTLVFTSWVTYITILPLHKTVGVRV